MKSIYFYLSMLLMALSAVSCVDESLIKEDNKKLPPDTNYKEFADGYSIAFNITIDRLGGSLATRGDTDQDDYDLEFIENYIDPEEFRILFFTNDDKFLFESKSRWLTEVEAKSGSKAWRVGVPIFQYLSDNFTQEGSTGGDNNITYKWDEMVQYLKNNKFKIAILANRPDRIDVPALSDWEDNVKGMTRTDKCKNFDMVGPFWGPKNSCLTTLEDLKKWEPGNYDDLTNEGDREVDEKIRVMSVFDLHHSQYDPIYDAKNNQGGSGSAYEHIAKWVYDTDFSPNEPVPYMGAVSNWLGNEKRYISSNGKELASQEEYNPDAKEHVKNGEKLNERSFYRLPIDKTGKENGKPNYIPMYGIQRFEPLTDWTKGTTYNISEQTASQAKDYIYKSIFLLRSVVKLELRIPMYDDTGNLVDVDLNYATLMLNNYLARSEPMDVSSPTDSIWDPNHNTCEWVRIKGHGPFIHNKGGDGDYTAYRNRIAWYYGIWQYFGWEFHGKYGQDLGVDFTTPENEATFAEYPHIFNPIVQRLQFAFISNNFLPMGISRDEFINPDWKGNPERWKLGKDDELTLTNIPETLTEAKSKYPSNQGYYYRWVIYCGERNINDANTLGNMNTSSASRAYVAMFRVKIGDKIWRLPIMDYSTATTNNSPLKNLLDDKHPSFGGDDDTQTKSTAMPKSVEQFCVDVVNNNNNDYDNLPYPLIRNHLYRMTLSFKNGGSDLSIQVLNSDERKIDIPFGRE